VPELFESKMVVVLMKEIMFEVKLKMFMLTTAAVFSYAQKIQIKTSNALEDYQSNDVIEIYSFIWNRRIEGK